MDKTKKVRVLDEDFPIEVAFWEANKEDLTRRYPGKYLIIRGEEVQGVLDTIEEVRLADQKELMDNPALVRLTDNSEPVTVFSPFSYVEDRA